MLISLPLAMLIKKMGVTVFSLLLTVHLDFKNKNVPYLERERRRKGWIGLVNFRASQVCAGDTELHALGRFRFPQNTGLLNPAYPVATNIFPILPGFPK